MMNREAIQWRIFLVTKMVLLYTCHNLRYHHSHLKQTHHPAPTMNQSKLIFVSRIFLYYTYRVSQYSRHRSRALSRPEVQLRQDTVKLRQDKQRKLRRYSISVITRDGVRESGSEQFQKALKQDSVHETHPGWQSLRRMTGVIG